MGRPAPADEAGAELAVARPRLPGHDLEELLNAVEIPLAAARGLDDQRLRAFTAEIGRLGRVTDAGRLAIGAALHERRGRFKQGEWTPFVAGLAEAAGVASRTLGDWMLAAERHYGLELAKAAKPTLRGRQPRGLSAGAADTKPAAGGTASPLAGRGGSPQPPAPAAAPGGDDSPGAGATLEPPPTSRVASHAGRPAQRGERQPGPAGAASGARPIPPARPTLSAALNALLDAPATELALRARDERTKVTAARDALTRALVDARRPPAQVVAIRPAADVFDAATCPHPKERRDVKPWGTLCGACGVRVS